VEEEAQTPLTEQQLVRDVGASLLEFGSHFGRGTFTNAYVWSERYGLHAALVGNPLKVARLFGHMPSLDEDHEYGMRGSWLDRLARRVFGQDADIFAYDNNIHFSEFLQRLANLLPGSVTLTFIPEPGYPWPVRSYWDAKKKRAVTPERPGWLIEVADRDASPGSPSRPLHGVNPCLVFPAKPVVATKHEPVMGMLGGSPVMVAHSMSFTPNDPMTERASSIRACGGLLFPSLSVGPIPAANFGYGCLVARLGLVIDSLKPYRSRGDDPSVWVYGTDVWSGTVKSFMESMARDLFDELHGHDDYVYGHGFAILGTPRVSFGGPSEGNEALDKTSQLKRAIQRRLKPWAKVRTPEAFARLNQELGGTDEKYVYCEAKGRETIALTQFPYLVVPDASDRGTWGAGARHRSVVEMAKEWAVAAGYTGTIVPVEWHEIPDSSGTFYDREWDQWLWAHRVAEVVRELRSVVEITT
jgi:hypothetical protein